MTVELAVEKDRVWVANQVIQRPKSISRSEWLKFWENAEAYPNKRCKVCEEEY